jgi:hypothetical protein
MNSQVSANISLQDNVAECHVDDVFARAVAGSQVLSFHAAAFNGWSRWYHCCV